MLIAETSLSCARVARELTALIRIYGKLGYIVTDNDTEFNTTMAARRELRAAINLFFV